MKVDATDYGFGCSGLHHAMRRSEVYITRALRNAVDTTCAFRAAYKLIYMELGVKVTLPEVNRCALN
jgi:hypothetical protein